MAEEQEPSPTLRLARELLPHGPVRVVDTLPEGEREVGQVVFLTMEHRLYRYTERGWWPVIPDRLTLFTAGAAAMRELCAQWHDAEAERLVKAANTYGSGTIERSHFAARAREHRDMGEAMRAISFPSPTPKDTPR